MEQFFFDDINNCVVDTYYSLCKPRINPVVTEYCTNLTGITQEMIDHAPTFDKAIAEFENISKMLKENSANIEYCVWGNFDRLNLKRLVKGYNYDKLFRAIVYELIDIQPQISKSILYEGKVLRKQWGLAKAKQIYNIECGHTEHNAFSDAEILCQVYLAYKTNKKLNIKFLEEVFIEDQKKDLELALAAEMKCNDFYKELPTIVCTNVTEDIFNALQCLLRHSTYEVLFDKNIHFKYNKNGLTLLDSLHLKNTKMKCKQYFTLECIDIKINKEVEEEYAVARYIQIEAIVNTDTNTSFSVAYKMELETSNYKFMRRLIRLCLSSEL